MQGFIFRKTVVHTGMVSCVLHAEITIKRKTLSYNKWAFKMWGMRWCSWLRDATSRKATGSIPDGVIGIFH